MGEAPPACTPGQRHLAVAVPWGPSAHPALGPGRGSPAVWAGTRVCPPVGVWVVTAQGPRARPATLSSEGTGRPPTPGQRQQTRGRLPNKSARRGRVSSVPAVPDSPFSPALVTVRPGSPAPQRSARHGLSVPSRTGVKGPGDPGTRPSPRPRRSFSPSTRPTPPPPSYPGSNRRRGLFRLRWGVERRDRAAA